MMTLFFIKETGLIDGLIQELSEGGSINSCLSNMGAHSSHLMPYHKTYQNFSEDGKIETSTSQKESDELPKVPYSEVYDMDEDFNTPNDNVEQHQTVEMR